MRSVLRVLALVAALAGGLAFLQRSRREARERVELHFDDGSVIALGPDTVDAERLLPLARRILASARG